MPGLLQTQAEHFTKTKYIMALCAEFLGSMLFSFTGSALLSVALASPTDPNVVMAALGNAAGITVAGTRITITRATHTQAEHAEPAQLRSLLLPYKLSKRTPEFASSHSCSTTWCNLRQIA